MTKFERLLGLVRLLVGNRSLGAEELARKSQVSRRTIFRDLKLLTRAGLILQGRSGYELASKSIFSSLELSAAEYLTLYWALQSSIVKDKDHLGTLGSKILTKLRSSLSGRTEAEASSLKEFLQIEVKQTGRPQKEGVFFTSLQKALSENVVVQIEYDSINSGVSSRRVDPYALVFRRHAWYLLGLDYRSQEFRVFRLSRIKKLTLKSEKFYRDPNFSVEKMFEHSWEVFLGQPAAVKARFTGRAAKIIASGKRHPSEKLLLQKDGSVICTATVAGLEEVSHWLMSFGSEVEVLEPALLRSRFKTLAQKLNQIYCQRYSLAAEPRPIYRPKSVKRQG